MKKFLCPLLTLFVAQVCMAPHVQAQPTPNIKLDTKKVSSNLDPAAVARLEQSAKAYAALASISMQFVSSSQFETQYENSAGTIILERPDRVRFELVENGFEEFALSDGQKLVRLSDDDEYVVSKIVHGPHLNLIQRVLKNAPLGVDDLLPQLAVGKNPLTLKKTEWEKAALLPDNGVALTRKALPNIAAMVCHLYFDPSDYLLRRAEVKLTWRGRTGLEITTFTNVQLNPTLLPDTFVFTTPPDSKLIVGSDIIAPEDITRCDPRLKVGTKPFPLKGRDLKGKLHSWSQYRGKVVLLDFWSTWCKPCVREVPNLVHNLKKYHRSGFRVLGVSLDKNKAELQKFIKAHHIQYPNLFEGSDGKNDDAQSYGVRGIPFTLLIGKDGKIAAVNPGGPALEVAIQKALRAQ